MSNNSIRQRNLWFYYFNLSEKRGKKQQVWKWGECTWATSVRFHTWCLCGRWRVAPPGRRRSARRTSAYSFYSWCGRSAPERNDMRTEIIQQRRRLWFDCHVSCRIFFFLPYRLRKRLQAGTHHVHGTASLLWSINHGGGAPETSHKQQRSTHGSRLISGIYSTVFLFIRQKEVVKIHLLI